MSSLHKYWIREFFRFFVMIQTMILVIFIIIDYLSRLNKFLAADLGLGRGLWYVILKLPFMFVQLTPAAILLSTIVVFSLMNKNHELTIIKSAGISAHYLVRPAIAAALGLAFLMFFLGETLIPLSMSRANHIRYVELSKKSRMSSGKQDIWIKSKNVFIHISYFDPENETISGITITSMDDEFAIENRLFAKRGKYAGKGKWILEDIQSQPLYTDRFSDDSHFSTPKDSTNPLLALELPIDITPEELGKAVKKTDEMSFSQLRHYVDKVESEGYDATVYRVDMHAKPAFVFICIIMALAGAALGLRSFARESLPLAIAAGLAISFAYWVVFGICISMGYGGILPPMAAAWVTNLIFTCGGGLLLMTTQ